MVRTELALAMTTTMLSPEAKALTSPGAAISARQALEDEQWRLIEPLLEDLLEAIHRLAVAALSAPVLIAAGRVRDPFSYTAIMREWTATVRELAATRGQVLGPITDALRDSDIPMRMYRDTTDLLRRSREEEWTDYRTKVALRKLLVPPRPGKGMPVEQASYRAKIRMVARTASTRTFNERQLQALRRTDVGYVKWVTRRDAKVRATHHEVDGAIVPIGIDFIVGGHAMSYPGDPKAPPSETVNCRCVLIGDTGDVDRRIDFPMNYGMDPFQGALVQLGELTPEEVVKIGEIPPWLGSDEVSAMRLLTRPDLNGQIQWDLRSGAEIPHLPTTWGIDPFANRLIYAKVGEHREPTLEDLLGGNPWEVEPGIRFTREGLIHAIDAGIDRAHTTEPSIVYRGFVAWKDLKPGDEFGDRGYVSTTPDIEVAQRFVAMRTGASREQTNIRTAETYEGQPLVAFIKLPTNTPIGLGDPTVAEFMLPRDSRFRILDVNPPYILMERIP